MNKTPNKQNQKALAAAYDTIVKYIAGNATFTTEEVENVENSGARIARGLREMVWTTEEIITALEKALATTFPVSDDQPLDSASPQKQPIVVGPIETHSLCPHHLLPIVNRVFIGYVADERVIGLSKLPRIADALARRAVVQEQYTADIAQVLTTGTIGDEKVGPPLSSSVAVNVKAVHHCMVCRGVKGNASTTTEVLTGAFNTGVREYSLFSRLLKD